LDWVAVFDGLAHYVLLFIHSITVDAVEVRKDAGNHGWFFA
jgi:hypothetical protein